ncbi:MAG: beta-ketoacyl-[acyl-carrier-protein] synthase family protein [Rhodocyclaceae bacterium]
MGDRRVAITGLGVVSPVGTDAGELFAGVLSGNSCISLHGMDDPPRVLSIPAAVCTHFDADAALGHSLAGTMDRYCQLGVSAAFDAWRHAGFPRDKSTELPDVGIAWGTALGGTLAYERGYRELWQKGRDRVHPLSVVLGMNNAASAHISIELALGGPSLTYSMACASAAAAIGEAFHKVRAGAAKVMLAGGSDAPLAYGVVRAWEALRVLAPADADNAPYACRPFHAQRAGLVLGEGAAALVLEDWEHALGRGAVIHGEICGYGAASDHRHLVRPDPAGQIRALKAALADARLDTAEIDYVNAHGTATREGDTAEITAIQAVFGPSAPNLPVSATKSMHGHMMGAAGAIEAVITVLALRKDALPPTAHLDDIDAACRGVHHIVGSALRGRGARAALSNSFAFGGSNVVLAFRAVRSGQALQLPRII